MKVVLVTPAAPGSSSGNRVTAERWARLSRQLGHEAETVESWDGGECDVLVALHARRSAESVARAEALRPELPRVVVLTGTDLYRDLPGGDAVSRATLARADLVVGLHGRAASALPDDVGEEIRRKVRIVYQSAEAVPGQTPPRQTPPRQTPDESFQVAMLAHLRPVKDPLLAVRAAQRLPAGSRIEIVHAGDELVAETAESVRRAAAGVRCYRWIGPLPRTEALELLASSRLVLVTSQMEGGANVVSEALVHDVPILSTAIDGTMGVLGADYAGLYPVGDAEALARRLCRVETEPAFLAALAERCRSRRPLVTPERERRDLAALWAEAVGLRRETGPS